jgi:hypothetical protein
MACIGTTFTSPILKRNIARANSDAFHFCFLYRMRQEFSKQPNVVKHRVSGGFCGTLYVIPAFTERGEKYVNGLIYMHIAAKHKVVTFHCVISLFLTSDCSSDWMLEFCINFPGCIPQLCGAILFLDLVAGSVVVLVIIS